MAAVPALVLRQKKGRVSIVESAGRLTLEYEINLRTLRCPCADSNRNRGLCKHILFYLDTVGADQKYCALIAVPQIKDWLMGAATNLTGAGKPSFGVMFNEHCRSFLEGHECSMCLCPLVSKGGEWTLEIDARARGQHLFQCTQGCGGLFHTNCRERWKGACPLCRKDRGLPL